MHSDGWQLHATRGRPLCIDLSASLGKEEKTSPSFQTPAASYPTPQGLGGSSQFTFFFCYFSMWARHYNRRHMLCRLLEVERLGESPRQGANSELAARFLKMKRPLLRRVLGGGRRPRNTPPAVTSNRRRSCFFRHEFHFQACIMFGGSRFKPRQNSHQGQFERKREKERRWEQTVEGIAATDKVSLHDGTARVSRIVCQRSRDAFWSLCSL